MDVEVEDKKKMEKQKQDVILAFDKEKKTVAAVKGVDDKGELQTIPAKSTQNNEFLKLDRNGDVLSNFLSNFNSQLKDPTRFSFFKVDAEKIEASAKMILNHMKTPTTASEAKIDKLRVDVESSTPKKNKTTGSDNQIYANADDYFVNPNKIDWESLKSFGISREQLEKSTAFESMLRGYKSPNTFPIEAKMSNVTFKTDARISFRPDSEGDVILAIHGIRKQPELNRSYFGHEFTNEDKENLLKTGNMGRKVDIKNYFTGETIPSFISIDKLTNELVSMKADKLSFPDKISGVDLNEKQKSDLKDGKAVWVENMISAKNTPYSAFLQINADKRSLEFIFPENNQNQIRNQNEKQSHESGVRIPKALAGVDLTEKQQNDLKSDKTIYVKGLKDKAGQEYNAYIKVNPEENKLDFFRFNPDKAKAKGKEVTPVNEHKTQVAVNSEGKTNEATKKMDVPLRKSQSKPTNAQAEKQQKKEAKASNQLESSKKRKGRKM